MTPTPFFTVFTPAYNCAGSINRVFDSINAQKFRNFEWIIVNDGSTDNTSTVIAELLNTLDSDILVTYIEQENSGKHSCWNKAVGMAKGSFFVPADADDSFVANSLQFFYDKIIAFPEPALKKISGINVLCFDNDTDHIVGDCFPNDGYKTNNFDLAYRNKVSGEKWGCVKLVLLKQHPFPQIKNSYYPEAYLWFTLAKHYSVICYNTALRRYYTSAGGIVATNSKFRSLSERKVNVQFYRWLLANFGLKILIYSPATFFRHAMKLIVESIYLEVNSINAKQTV